MQDEVIWRYMDFTKFVDLLSTKAVFFCRADRLEDPFEGSVPKRHHDKRIHELRTKLPDFDQEFEVYSRAGASFKKFVFINCWHRNEGESAALWRLYLKSNEGIAIRSSRDRLSSSFVGSAPPVWTVPVQYIDFSVDDPPVPTRWAPFRYKRKSFEHERELRAMIFADVADKNGEPLEPPADHGIRVQADLVRLIDSVNVAPSAPDWFHALVQDVALRFGFQLNVRKSSLETDQALFV
jgi:hypothetical protein